MACDCRELDAFSSRLKIFANAKTTDFQIVDLNFYIMLHKP